MPTIEFFYSFWLVAWLGQLAFMDFYPIFPCEKQGQDTHPCKKSSQSAKALLKYEFFPIT